MEALRRRGAGTEGRAAAAELLGERELGLMEARDLSKRRGGNFAERREAVVQKR